MEIADNTIPAEKKLFIARQLVNREGLMGVVLGALSREGLLGQRRFNPASLAVSVINTGRRRLPAGIAAKDREELDEMLRNDVPTMDSGLDVPVRGLGLYGNTRLPFVGLTIGGHDLERERDDITRSLRGLDQGFHLGRMPYTLHVSIAKASSFEDGKLMIKALEDSVPQALELQEADVQMNRLITKQVDIEAARPA